jgi:cytochrome c
MTPSEVTSAANPTSVPDPGASSAPGVVTGGAGGDGPSVPVNPTTPLPSNDAGAGGHNGAPSAADASDPAPHAPAVLLFSKTAEFRHESIEAGIVALSSLASSNGWTLEATEDAARFNDEDLASFNVVVFLNTSEDVFELDQQAALQRFIRAGNGFVGIHGASTTEYDWPWFGELVGAYFNKHPEVQNARIQVTDREHSSTRHLPETWERVDEWYGFVAQPAATISVLMLLDESSYAPGESSMGPVHPIAWYHEYDGGRAFYTALGHTEESYQEQLFLDHVAGGITWAAGD